MDQSIELLGIDEFWDPTANDGFATRCFNGNLNIAQDIAPNWGQWQVQVYVNGVVVGSPYSFQVNNSAAQTGTSGIVISQVYGGGGNANATLRNDFIELFNRGAVAVNVAGWTVQYASADGTLWNDRTPLSGVIQPGQYYLIQEHAEGGGSVSLPTPDVSGAINLSLSDGKVALVSEATPLSGAVPSGPIVDFVGYGRASAAEGSHAVAAQQYYGRNSVVWRLCRYK